MKPPRIGVLLGFLLPSSVMMYAVFQGIQQILLPAQVESIDPSNKIANLALLTVVSSIAAVIGLPLGGSLSDRTRGRFGRRSPWLLGTAAVSALLLAVMGTATEILLLAVIYGALWFSMNFYQASLTAVLPDRVPRERLGLGSAVIGLGTPIGILVGVNAIARVDQQMGYVVLAVGIIAITALFVFVAREPAFTEPLPRREKRTAVQRMQAFVLFFAAFRSRDFTLAFFQRALIFFASFTVSGYLFYIVQDYVGVDNLPSENPKIAVSILSTVQTVAWIAAVPIFGWLSDKLDRRKLFVLICSIGFAAAMVIPIVLPTWQGLLAYKLLVGIFMGSYMAIDLALMTLVLPSQENAGRDLAVLAVATAGPQVLAPIVGAALLGATGSYVAIFGFGVVTSLLAGVLILFIRSVR
ncbi:MFS transporter [Rhodococcus sp. SC4]|nr:MFS transporter [Rhodococcus sp. SC4]